MESRCFQDVVLQNSHMSVRKPWTQFLQLSKRLHEKTLEKEIIQVETHSLTMSGKCKWISANFEYQPILLWERMQQRYDHNTRIRKAKKIFRVLFHKCLKFWKANDNTIWGLIFREFIPKISDQYYTSIITNAKAGVANTGSIFAIIPAYYHFRWVIFIFFILFGERIQIRIKLLIIHIHLPTHYFPKNIS